MTAAPLDLKSWFRQFAGISETITPAQVPELVDRILEGARSSGASDIHLRPTGGRMEMRWRIDGVIQTVDSFPAEIANNIVARLKVLANLLTYRVDVPQEGRVQSKQLGNETRISVFPTQFGEKVVVRLFADSGKLERIADLDLPEDIVEQFQHLLNQTSGVIILTG